MRGYPDWQRDEYTKQTHNQNNGGVCQHCTAEWGHYSVCPLLAVEAQSIAQAEERTAAHFAKNVNEGFYRRERIKAEIQKTPDVIELERIFSLNDPR